MTWRVMVLIAPQKASHPERSAGGQVGGAQSKDPVEGPNARRFGIERLRVRLREEARALIVKWGNLHLVRVMLGVLAALAFLWGSA